MGACVGDGMLSSARVLQRAALWEERLGIEAGTPRHTSTGIQACCDRLPNVSLRL